MSDITINVKAPSVNVNATPQSNVITPKIQIVGGGASITVDDALSLTSENPVQNKVITSALNEKAPIIINTASGEIASFPDGADDMPIRSLVANIEPVQDLNGQDAPYPPGGGKNLLETIGDGGTNRGITATVNDDGTITLTGTNDGTSYSSFTISNSFQTESGVEYVLNGAVSSDILIRNVTAGVSDIGNGVSFTGSGSANVIQLRVLANTAISGSVVVKPMIRLSSVTDATFSPYSNICPISGHTGMNVTKTGKNLIRYPYSQESRTTNGITYTNNADGSVTVSGTASAIAYHNLKSWSSDVNSPLLKAGTTLTLSGGTVDARIYVQYRTADSTQNVTLGIDNGSGVTFTIPEEADKYAIFIRVNKDITVDTTIYPMLRLASVADDTYEPYTATSIPITFPSEAGTVYGGTLDVTNGVLTVDRANIASYNGETLPSTWISDRDVYAQGTTPTTGAQVVYTLATPITYQLTPHEVDTLLGANSVWADTGDVEVKYPADTKLYIDNLIASLSS